MKEIIDEICLSDQANLARNKDLISKFVVDIEICHPENAVKARSIDLSVKIVDYREQLANIKNPRERKIILSRFSEAREQLLGKL